jgi:hypothetical protein
MSAAGDVSVICAVCKTIFISGAAQVDQVNGSTALAKYTTSQGTCICGGGGGGGESSVKDCPDPIYEMPY